MEGAAEVCTDFAALKPSKWAYRAPFKTPTGARLMRINTEDGKNDPIFGTPILKVGKDVEVTERKKPQKGKKKRKGKNDGKGDDSDEETESKTPFYPFEGSIPLNIGALDSGIIEAMYAKAQEIDAATMTAAQTHKATMWSATKSQEEIVEQFRRLARPRDERFGASIWVKIAMATDSTCEPEITSMEWGPTRSGKVPRPTPPTPLDLIDGAAVRAILHIKWLYAVGDKWGYQIMARKLQVWPAPRIVAPATQVMRDYGQALPEEEIEGEAGADTENLSNVPPASPPNSPSPPAKRANVSTSPSD